MNVTEETFVIWMQPGYPYRPMLSSVVFQSYTIFVIRRYFVTPEFKTLCESCQVFRSHQKEPHTVCETVICRRTYMVNLSPMAFARLHCEQDTCEYPTRNDHCGFRTHMTNMVSSDDNRRKPLKRTLRWVTLILFQLLGSMKAPG